MAWRVQSTASPAGGGGGGAGSRGTAIFQGDGRGPMDAAAAGRALHARVPAPGKASQAEDKRRSKKGVALGDRRGGVAERAARPPPCRAWVLARAAALLTAQPPRRTCRRRPRTTQLYYYSRVRTTPTRCKTPRQVTSQRARTPMHLHERQRDSPLAVAPSPLGTTHHLVLRAGRRRNKSKKPTFFFFTVGVVVAVTAVATSFSPTVGPGAKRCAGDAVRGRGGRPATGGVRGRGPLLTGFGQTEG